MKGYIDNIRITKEICRYKTPSKFLLFIKKMYKYILIVLPMFAYIYVSNDDYQTQKKIEESRSQVSQSI